MPLVAPARISRAERARDAAIARATMAREQAAQREAERTAYLHRLAAQTHATPRTRDDDVPTALHTHQIAQGPTGRGNGITGARVDPRNASGSLEWTRAMVTYLGNDVPVLLAEAQLPAAEWPRSSYVVARLRALLGQETVEAALALHAVNAEADDMSENEWHAAKQAIATHYDKSLGWLYRQERRVMDLVRGRYRMPTATTGMTALPWKHEALRPQGRAAAPHAITVGG